MEENFDVDKFITIIKSKESIWNYIGQRYTDRPQRNRDWISVSELMVPEFAEKSKKEKNAVVVELQGRWKVLRDGFMRNLRLQKKKNKRAIPPKLYTYYKQLLFLKSLHEERNSRESNATIESEEELVETYMGRPKRKKKNDELDDTLIKKVTQKVSEELKLSQENEQDEDRYFLLSLLKDFKRIPEENKLDAKSDIFNTLRRYRNMAPAQSANPSFEIIDKATVTGFIEAVKSEEDDI